MGNSCLKGSGVPVWEGIEVLELGRLREHRVEALHAECCAVKCETSRSVCLTLCSKSFHSHHPEEQWLPPQGLMSGACPGSPCKAQKRPPGGRRLSSALTPAAHGSHSLFLLGRVPSPVSTPPLSRTTCLSPCPRPHCTPATWSPPHRPQLPHCKAV